MNACKIFLLIISIFSKNIQNITCTNTSEIDSGVFQKNTKAIHNTMNKIFTSLKLNETFKESAKIRLLITMHKNLINIIRNNYKKSEVGNNSDNMPIKAFPKNNIDEILDEEYMLLFFSPNETVQHDFQIKTLSDSVSYQFFKHLKEFFLKIDNITSYSPKTNHDTPGNNDTISFNKTSARRSGRKTLARNLKPWVPDAAQSFAFNRRIFRSKKTKLRKYPFMASVHISGEFVCAGSIISLDLIITAASCLQVAYLSRNTKGYQSNVSVRFGSDYSTYDGKFIPISFIYFHPDYNPGNLKHNLAVMRISKHKHFSKKNKVRRVMFDKTSYDLPSDVKRVTIVGWGATDVMNRKESDILSLSHLDLYDTEECKSVYSDLYVTESNFCAGFISKGSGACNKDIGDPAVVAGVLVGVVSFGPPHCGTPDAPTVFTRLGPYADWIDSLLKMDKSTKTESRPNLRTSARTSKKSKHTSKTKQKRKGVNGLGVIRLELPEEFFILKEILTDIARSNNSEINEVIDEGFDEEFLEFIKPAPKMILKNHPLVNRSLFGISGANFPQQINKPMTATTHAYNLNIPQDKFPDYGGDFQQIGELIDVFYQEKESNIPLISKYPSFMTKKPKQLNHWIQREGSTLNDPVLTTPLYDDGSDSNDKSSGNYEGTDSDEGMSIELKKTSTKPIDKITKAFFDFDDNEFNEYSDVKSTTAAPFGSKDFKKIVFVLENEVNVEKYDKPHSNPKKNSGKNVNKNENNMFRTTLGSDVDGSLPESEDSTELDDYIPIANSNFHYDSVANTFTKT